MSPTRLFIWIVGVLLVIAGLMVLFFQTGISQWIPASIAGAGLLLLVGLLVVSFANRAPTEDAHHDDRGGSQSVHKEEKHYHE